MLFKTQSLQSLHHHRVLLDLIYILFLVLHRRMCKHKREMPFFFFFLYFAMNFVPAGVTGSVLFFTSVSNSCTAPQDSKHMLIVNSRENMKSTPLCWEGEKTPHLKREVLTWDIKSTKESSSLASLVASWLPRKTVQFGSHALVDLLRRAAFFVAFNSTTSNFCLSC